MQGGSAKRLLPWEGDPDPSRLGEALLSSGLAPARVLRPSVRRGFLEGGKAAGGEHRGREPFVEVDWDTALDLVARAIGDVRSTVGNAGLYAGSYGWSSAGRFHHAQSQIHRFMNVIGGCTRSVQNYSHGAGETLLPYVLGDRRGLLNGQTSWEDIARHAGTVVMFGGAPVRNAQVNSGGVGRHVLRESLLACREAGVQLISISPVRDDTLPELQARWLAPRPGSDVALILGLAHTLLVEGLHDTDFLARCTSGFDRFADYLMGRDEGVPRTAEWAAALCELPAAQIRELAREMALTRTMLMMSWSLQRAEFGEQPYWALVALASMLGQVGLPGGGFGFGYGCVNGVGRPLVPINWPAMPQGTNPVTQSIPVARIADMLLNPGELYDFDGRERAFPHVRLVYWAGGNPFHHHQDLNRLVRAWQKPEAVIVHESFWTATARFADIVLPATTLLERNDIACSARDNLVSPSHRIAEPAGQARDDHAIFAALAQRLGAGDTFTEGLDEEGWLRRLYSQACEQAQRAGHALPDFDMFWQGGPIVLPAPAQSVPLLAAFAADPAANPLPTPSGLIELYSDKIASYGYDDCPPHPAWLEPVEWLGAQAAQKHPLHLVSNAPANKLHSQYDHGELSRADKLNGREPLRIHPQDAASRGISQGNVVRVFNERGACLASACLSDQVRCGVVQMATGAWYDPLVPGEPGTLDKHGNPNVLTQDVGTSRLAQATSALSCLVEVQRFVGELPPLTCHAPPPLQASVATTTASPT